MITTTLNRILACTPCVIGWYKLTNQSSARCDWVGNDDALPFSNIIESNGLVDAFWALRTIHDYDQTDKFLKLAMQIHDLYIEVTGLKMIKVGIEYNEGMMFSGVNCQLSQPRSQHVFATQYASYVSYHLLVCNTDIEDHHYIRKELTKILMHFTGE